MFIFTLAGAAALAGGGLYLASHLSRARAQLLRDTPTTPLAELTKGPLREVKGAVHPYAPALRAPLSGRPCVYFRFEVEQRHESRDSEGTVSETWVRRVFDEKRALAVVTDESGGSAYLDLTGAELHLDEDVHAESGFLNDPSPELRASLKANYNFDTQGLLLNKKLRYRETVIAPGDRLYILGRVGERPEGLCLERGGEAFLVSDKSEDALVARFEHRATSLGRFVWVGALFAVVFTVIGVLYELGVFG